jgi:hypothetical protein
MAADNAGGRPFRQDAARNIPARGRGERQGSEAELRRFCPRFAADVAGTIRL